MNRDALEQLRRARDVPDELEVRADARYVHLTSNETIEGPAGLAVGVIRRSPLLPCATGLPACLGYQGHRSVGGFRAGLNNAMPDERDLARRAG